MIAWRHTPDYPLIVAANRDEYFDRPTESARFWPQLPGIFAGRDLEHGGSWLGVSRSGRFAAVTNLRFATSGGERSRGNLIRDFLASEASAKMLFQRLEEEKAHYRPFNLIASDGHQLLYTHNSAAGWQVLNPGIHVIANVTAQTPSQKRDKGAEALRSTLTHAPTEQALLATLEDRTVSEPEEEPLLQELSRRFVSIDQYGTRSSSALIQHGDRGISFWEQNYDESQRPMPLRQHWIAFNTDND